MNVLTIPLMLAGTAFARDMFALPRDPLEKARPAAPMEMWSPWLNSCVLD